MIPEKYNKIIDNVLNIYNESGVSMPEKLEDFWKTWATEELLFRFYWNTLSSIDTIEGRIPVRSTSGNGNSHSIAEEALKDFFGLELIKTIDGVGGERWFIYRPTKNISE